MSGATAYGEYTSELRQLTADAAAGRRVPRVRLLASVDGEASEQLRRLVPLDYRREVGAFFTPAPLKQRITSLLRMSDSTVYLDPACGSGDLLIAAAEALPTGPSLDATLKDWTDRLHGHDLNGEFVEAARHRLTIAAMLRHKVSDRSAAASLSKGALFSNITVADGIDRMSKRSTFEGHILLNPPFGTISSIESYAWTKRPTSAAAIFAYQAIRHLTSSSRMTAILPDVLRSGSRYRAWRALMDEVGLRQVAETYGQFDDHADIDVFVLGVMASERPTQQNSSEWWTSTQQVPGAECVRDHFEIRVGPVVDNRDPMKGSEYPFARARDLPPSGEISLPVRTRRFTGRVFTPPFVVIRRTSRPIKAGQGRISGVVVTGSEPVAVDNHLILAFPKHGGLTICRNLLEVLSRHETSEWLDNRIRCRHLTVGAVREIPWRPGQ